MGSALVPDFLPLRAKAQTLVDSLSELMVDASLGTIQCLEEMVIRETHYQSCNQYYPVIELALTLY